MCTITRSQRGYTGCGQAFRRAVMERRYGGRVQPLWEETHRLHTPSSAAGRTTSQPDGTLTTPGRQRSSATRGCAGMRSHLNESTFGLMTERKR